MSIDTEQIKANIDLRDLAADHTELHKESAKSLCGPCPKCGGDDRFYVTADKFYCRGCQAGGDAIQFVRWLHNVDFREACELLQPGAELPAGTPTVQKVARQPAARQQQITWNSAYHARQIEHAHERLFESPEAEPGREYLIGRCIEPGAWLAFWLGYTANAMGKGPAIAMPWYRAGELVAIRYRLLEPTDGQKLISEKGSRFSGLLFGGQALPEFVSLPPGDNGKCAEQLRTLILCEGELNAISIWQTAADSAVDVLSVGSESQRIPDSLPSIAGRYGAVFTWFDKPENAKSSARLLPGAHAISLPDQRDANDLLQAGLLGGFIAAARRKACETPTERERLLYSLMDIQAPDAGIAQIAELLGAEIV